jgi:chemotaxis protein CheD
MSRKREQAARMGEMVISTAPGDVLVSVGLGSCIGLALVEPVRRIGALAHIMLPASPEGHDGTGGEAKFADLAVPLALERLCRAGAAPERVQAALVGGAQMFSLAGGGLDIGSRNEHAVRTELDRAAVSIHAIATGGTSGRTVRVHVGDGRVTVKSARGHEVDLLGGAA